MVQYKVYGGDEGKEHHSSLNNALATPGVEANQWLPDELGSTPPDNFHVNIYAGEDNHLLINLFPSDGREDDPGGNLDLHHYAFNKSHDAHPNDSVADPHANVNVTTGGKLSLPTDHFVNNHNCKTAYNQEPAALPADPPDPYVGLNPSYKPRKSGKIWQGGPNNSLTNMTRRLDPTKSLSDPGAHSNPKTLVDIDPGGIIHKTRHLQPPKGKKETRNKYPIAPWTKQQDSRLFRSNKRIKKLQKPLWTKLRFTKPKNVQLTKGKARNKCLIKINRTMTRFE